jgi:hypothetical protein
MQWLATLVSLIAYICGAASINSLFSDCMVEATTGYKLFNLMAIFTGGFQPFVLASLSLLMLYTLVLAMCWRVWRLARDGADSLSGEEMGNFEFIPTLFYFLWPAFNLFFWVFSLSIPPLLLGLLAHRGIEICHHVHLHLPPWHAAPLLGEAGHRRQLGY